MDPGENRHETDTLGTLIGLIGKDEAFALVGAFSGRRLFIPRRTEGTKLRDAISAAAAGIMAAQFGGLYLKIPLARQWRAAVYRERGMSWSGIATAIGCSESAVGRYLKDTGLTGARQPGSRHPSCRPDQGGVPASATAL